MDHSKLGKPARIDAPTRAEAKQLRAAARAHLQARWPLSAPLAGWGCAGDAEAGPRSRPDKHPWL